jgi:hypothetical protein
MSATMAVYMVYNSIVDGIVHHEYSLEMATSKHKQVCYTTDCTTYCLVYLIRWTALPQC